MFIGNNLIVPNNGLKPQDYFKTTLWFSNGGEGQICRTGFDMTKKKGMIWDKSRNQSYGHEIFDTIRGPGDTLASHSVDGYFDSYRSFRTDGFSGRYNSNDSRVAWSFLEGRRFFSMVTYTGNGADGRVIAHNLGIRPGMIIIKRLYTSSQWFVGHTSLPDRYYINLNRRDEAVYDAASFNFGASEFGSQFFVISSNSNINAPNGQYIAYLFAHDPDPSGIIQCGTFNADSTGSISNVNLGWRPQYILIRDTDTTDDWYIVDSSRGLAPHDINRAGAEVLWANDARAPITTGSVSNNTNIETLPTGFRANAFFRAYVKHIYMAIRSPV